MNGDTRNEPKTFEEKAEALRKRLEALDARLTLMQDDVQLIAKSIGDVSDRLYTEWLRLKRRA